MKRNEVLKKAFLTYQQQMIIYTLFLPVLGSVIVGISWAITLKWYDSFTYCLVTCYPLGVLMAWGSIKQLKKVKNALYSLEKSPETKITYSYDGKVMNIYAGNELIPYPRFMANKKINSIYEYLKEHGQKK
jgi:hypothetical protein